MSNKQPINIQQFEVCRHESSNQTVSMIRGIPGTENCKEWEEPKISHRVIDKRNDVIVGTVRNSTTLCLSGGSVRATDATDEQIIRAVVGDEHIFTGERSYQPAKGE